MAQRVVRPYYSGYLNIGDIHQVYYSCWGNDKGKTILLLHGGPGYGSDVDMLYGLDLSKWNIIMFDQRGSGLSLPLGELKENTTAFLIEDIKILLDYLGKTKVVIKGNSWGATLAVAFAEKYPRYVNSLILTGFFNGENEGTLFGKNIGFEKYYPDLFYEFVSVLRESEKGEPYSAYYYRLMNNDKDSDSMARRVIKIESLMEKKSIDYIYAENVCNSVDVLSVAKIEMHYAMNDFFLQKGALINNASRLKNIKITMIHGRFDIITPVYYAWKMSKAVSLCDFYIIEDCGHDIDSLEGRRVLINTIDKHYEGGFEI